MTDTFHVNRVKIFGHKLAAQSELFTFVEGTLQYFIPTVGLKNGDVIVFLYWPIFSAIFIRWLRICINSSSR